MENYFELPSCYNFFYSIQITFLPIGGKNNLPQHLIKQGTITKSPFNFSCTYTLHGLIAIITCTTRFLHHLMLIGLGCIFPFISVTMFCNTETETPDYVNKHFYLVKQVSCHLIYQGSGLCLARNNLIL